MGWHLGKYKTFAYSDGEEIDSAGPFYIFAAADKYAKDKSMELGQTCLVFVKDVPDNPEEEPKILRVYRRSRQMPVKDYI